MQSATPCIIAAIHHCCSKRMSLVMQSSAGDSWQNKQQAWQLMSPFLCMQPGVVEGDNSEEAIKKKSIKALLNKPEKFGKLFDDIVAVGYDTEQTVAGLVDQVLPHSTFPM